RCRVTAVEDRRPARFRVDLDEQRGDELLVTAKAAAKTRVQPARQFGERARYVRLLTEHAEHVGGELDRAEALAAHVAYDHPDAVPDGGDGLVQVAAHLRLRGRGDVDDVKAERAKA